MGKQGTATTQRESWAQVYCRTDTPADRRNGRRIAATSLLWVAAFLGSLMVMTRYGDSSLAISSAALVVAAVAWIPVVRSYLRFLRETDELTRLVQMQAMAVAFAAGLLAGLLDRFVVQIAGFLPSSLIGPLEFTDLFNPVLVMCGAFTITSLVLQRWYSR